MSKGIKIALLVQELKAILLNGWILPIGGASSVEGLRSTGLSRLVSLLKDNGLVLHSVLIH